MAANERWTERRARKSKFAQTKRELDKKTAQTGPRPFIPRNISPLRFLPLDISGRPKLPRPKGVRRDVHRHLIWENQIFRPRKLFPLPLTLAPLYTGVPTRTESVPGKARTRGCLREFLSIRRNVENVVGSCFCVGRENLKYAQGRQGKSVKENLGLQSGKVE